MLAFFNLFTTYFYQSPFSFESNLDVRLDKTLSEVLKPILKKNDTLLLYEIELQYYIKNKVISFDGIVGNGEFMKFYQGKESLELALKENDINYIGIDRHSIAPPMRKSPLFMFLFDRRFIAKVGESVDFNGSIFTKVLENNSTKYNMWEVIYRVDYINIGGNQ